MMEREPLTAVIAEDEFLLAEDVAEAAREAGCRVLGMAADGARALELVEEHRPDVAILDIQMPTMDGLTAAARILERHATAVVIMSAYESGDFVARARDSGVGAYLVKPAEPGSLKRAIELAVARRRDLRELTRLNAQLAETLGHVRKLEGILPICVFCKNIRDEGGHWHRLETYLTERSGTELSHGLCPECAARHYPD
ncbi:MAG: response regulator [Anaeromyxobacteraceae bacterium]